MYKISDKDSIDSDETQGQLHESDRYCGLDIDQYLPYAEDWGMTLEEKREALKSLAGIIQHFVDKAWEPSDRA